MLLYLIIFLVFLLYLFVAYWNRMHFWQHQNVPCPPYHWFYGHMGDFSKGFSLTDIFYNYSQQFKKSQLPFVGLYVFVKPVMLVMDAQYAKCIMTKDFSYFRERGLYHSVDDLSSNLFTLEYDKWKELRTKLSPIFTTAKLKMMFSKFENVGDQLVNVLRSDLITSNGGIVNIKNLMLRFTIDIIGSCAFGIQANSLKNPNNAFSQIINQKCVGEENSIIGKIFILCFPNIIRWFKLNYMPKNLKEFYTKLIKHIVVSRENLQDRHNDFIDALINIKRLDGSQLSMKEMTSNSLLFFEAGFETSAYTITYILYELARHPQIQQKARLEIYSVLRDCNNQLTYECLSQMKYLAQIIKETERLYPLSPTILRECTQEYTTFASPNLPPVTIKRGTIAVIPVFSLHRDERYYSQAEQFNPDNFTEDKLKNNIFLSFGGGQRNCLGMRFANLQIMLGLVLLLKNFTFEFCKKTEEPIKFNAASVIMAPQNEIYLKVKPYALIAD